jgi:hypothetical protein
MRGTTGDHVGHAVDAALLGRSEYGTIQPLGVHYGSAALLDSGEISVYLQRFSLQNLRFYPQRIMADLVLSARCCSGLDVEVQASRRTEVGRNVFVSDEAHGDVKGVRIGVPGHLDTPNAYRPCKRDSVGEQYAADSSSCPVRVDKQVDDLEMSVVNSSSGEAGHLTASLGRDPHPAIGEHRGCELERFWVREQGLSVLRVRQRRPSEQLLEGP